MQWEMSTCPDELAQRTAGVFCTLESCVRMFAAVHDSYGLRDRAADCRVVSVRVPVVDAPSNRRPSVRVSLRCGGRDGSSPMVVAVRGAD